MSDDVHDEAPPAVVSAPARTPGSTARRSQKPPTTPSRSTHEPARVLPFAPQDVVFGAAAAMPAPVTIVLSPASSEKAARARPGGLYVPPPRRTSAHTDA